MTNTWAVEAPGLSPLEVSVVGPISAKCPESDLCCVRWFGWRAHAFCKTQIPQLFVPRETGRLPAGLSATYPLSWPSPLEGLLLSESSDPNWSVSPQPDRPSPKSHLCMMEKPHMSPEQEAGGERRSQSGIQETERTEMKDASPRLAGYRQD